MSLSQVRRIASNEFAQVIRNPVALVFIGLLLLICIIISLGGSIYAAGAPLGPENSLLTCCFGNSIFVTYIVLMTLTVCLGVFSISEERMNGALNTLLCKPVNRRDIITGKFLGISVFIILSILFALFILTGLSLIAFPAAASGITDIAERVSSYAFILILISIMTLAATMLIGIVFKKFVLSLAVSLTMAYLIINQDPLNVLGPIEILVPWYNFYNILFLRLGMELFQSVPYQEWLTSSIPLIILLAAEIIIVHLANLVIFNREEDK